MVSWKEYNERTDGCGDTLINTLLPKCETAVLLYFDDKREIYLPDNIVTRILSAFEKVANFRSSEELLGMPFHSNYCVHDVNIAVRFLNGKRGVSCDSDVMDYLLDVIKHTRGSAKEVFIFDYAMAQQGWWCREFESYYGSVTEMERNDDQFNFNTACDSITGSATG